MPQMSPFSWMMILMMMNMIMSTMTKIYFNKKINLTKKKLSMMNSLFSSFNPMTKFYQ